MPTRPPKLQWWHFIAAKASREVKKTILDMIGFGSDFRMCK